jgi:hypothetical protein
MEGSKQAGPNELLIVHQAFNGRLAARQISKGSPEAELAVAIILNLCREGNHTREALDAATSSHRAGRSD